MNYCKKPFRCGVPTGVWIAILLAINLAMYGGLLTDYALNTHETPHLYMRIVESSNDIAAHGWPVTLFPNVVHGGGFAYPMFYPPLSGYIALILYSLLGLPVLSVHLAFLASVMVSALTMFYACRYLVGNQGAFLASLVYIVLPYRFVDIMVRGALAESWTFAWFPLVFLGGVFIVQRRCRAGVPLLAVSVAALALTHTVMFLNFMIVFALGFGVYSVIRNRSAFWKDGLLFLVAGVLSICMTSWHLLPQRKMWKDVRATKSTLMDAVPDMVIAHAPDFSQLFFSRPDRWMNFGVSASVPGIQDAMSFELGVIQILIVILALVAVVYTVHSRRRVITTAPIILMLLLYAFIISIMVWPGWFYPTAPAQLSYIQFSWRWLGVLAFIASILGAMVIWHMRPYFRLTPASTLIAGGLVLAGVDPQFKTMYFHEPPVEDYSTETIRDWGVNGLVPMSEYLPRNFHDDMRPFLESGSIVVNTEDESREIDYKGDGVNHTIITTSTATVLFPRVYYRVWKVKAANGEKMSTKSHNGVLATKLDPGIHELRVERVHPPGRRTGLVVSAIAFLLAFFLVPTCSRLRTKFRRI